MCFLYRQSISIVYESKFKYIYRYFIKIDRCFCGILLSLPLRKCGLKSNTFETTSAILPSLPLRKCGLKYYTARTKSRQLSHFPCGSVDWNGGFVVLVIDTNSHFPCGSVDWNSWGVFSKEKRGWSLPLRKCGLKFDTALKQFVHLSHFPCGSVDWNRNILDNHWFSHSHFPCGSVDWNFSAGISLITCTVTSLAEVWIEIIRPCIQIYLLSSLPLRKCGLKWRKR